MRRAALVVLAVLIALPLLTAAGAYIWFDPEVIRTRLQDGAARATGKDVVIDGPVTLTWGPRLRVERLRLMNPPGLSRPELARVASAEIGMALLPLMSGRVELRGVHLDGVDMLFERDGSGRGNWERPPAPTPTGPPAQPSASGRRLEMSLESAILTNATFAYRDMSQTWIAQVPQLAIEAGRRVAGQAVLAGIPVQVAGTGPFPLALQITADRVPAGAFVIDTPRLTLAADGPDAPVRLDGSATIGGAPATLVTGAPSLRRMVTDGVLDRVSLTLGDATLAAEGRIDTRTRGADFTVRAHVPAVASVGAALGQVWPGLNDGDLKMQVTRTEAGIMLDGTATLAGSDATFLVGLGWPGWLPDGTVTAKRIDLDQMLPRPAAPQVAAALPALTPAPGTSVAPNPPSPPVAAAVPTGLPFAMLAYGSSTMQVSIGTLRWRSTDIVNVAVHARLDRGTLTLDPVRATVGGGPVDARLIATASPPHASLTAVAPGSDAAAIAMLAQLPPALMGRAELDVALDGAGRDWPTLLASATGRIGLAMVSGEADLSVIPGLTSNLAQITRGMSLPPMGTTQGRTPIRCLAIRTDLAAGQATVAALFLDTPRLTLTGEGTVGLTDRTLALRLRPSVAVGSATVSAPLRVSGPWGTPVIKLEGDGGRAGVSIATAPVPDECGPALALARNGRTGSVPPAPDPPKSTKPADLLRRLLR